MHDLKVWANIEADGSMPTTTPGKTSGKEDEMGRLAKVKYTTLSKGISCATNVIGAEPFSILH